MEEEWVTIEDWPDYRVSNLGRVYSVRSDIVMKGGCCAWGYLQVPLSIRGHTERFMVHRLVAFGFVEGYFDGLEVNHIDGNKINNVAWNLEWVTPSENIKHAYATKLRGLSGGAVGRAVRVIETGENFRNATECANHIGGQQGNVSACLRGERPRHKGFTFEYAD